MAALRRDLGDLLFHFTKSLPEAKQSPFTINYTAYGVLQSILRERKLRGSSKAVKGSHNVICFTEAPITEMAAIFNMAAISEKSEKELKYEPYGIALSKKWLYSKGGRPVIYQGKHEYDSLPDILKYRHVSYNPNEGPDFTWEREWRIKADELALDSENCLVVVPDAGTAFNLSYENADIEADFDRDGTPIAAYHVPRWTVVSLDLFGFTQNH